MTRDVTLSGRAVNFASRHLPAVNNWFSRRQAAQYESSGGRRAATLLGRPTFRLTVVGRRSGEPRAVMLMLVRRGEDLLVCGSQGGAATDPNWWKNLLAAGVASAQVGDESFEVGARVVTDEAERAEAWRLLVAAYPDFASYQALTARRIPIAVLTRTASGG